MPVETQQDIDLLSPLITLVAAPVWRRSVQYHGVSSCQRFPSFETLTVSLASSQRQGRSGQSVSELNSESA